MAATKATAGGATKRAGRTPAATGKVTSRGKGRAGRTQGSEPASAATATATATAPASSPTDAGASYKTADVTISGGGGTGLSQEAGAKTIYMGRTRKALSARSAKKIADALKLAGDATRVGVIWNLRATGPKNVTAICESFGLGQPAVSHHLSLLRHSGIVEARRDGKNNVYALTAKGEMLAEAMTGIEASGG